MPLGNLFERSRRSFLSADILSRRKLHTGVERKRLAIQHGKFVLKGTRKAGPPTIRDSKDKVSAESGARNRIMTIGLSESGKEIQQINPELFKDLVRSLLTMYSEMRKFLRTKHIHRVPINTGRLRRSITRTLGEHYRKIGNEQQLIMEIGSDTPYLPYVNEMPTNRGATGKHLRHPEYAKIGGGTTGDKSKASYVPEEDDPSALHRFMQWIVLNARQEATKIQMEVMKKVFAEWAQKMGWTGRGAFAKLRSLYTTTKRGW